MTLVAIVLHLVRGVSCFNASVAPPELVAAPYAPPNFMLPYGNSSREICIVPANSTDAGPSIVSAVCECNDEGAFLFSANQSYTISTPLDLTFLNNIDIAISGTILFDDSPGHWINKTFNYAFQGASLLWRFVGGVNMRIYGNGLGTIDGQGQTYWNELKTDFSVLRTILIATDGLKQSSISRLNLVNPPNWFHLIANLNRRVHHRYEYERRSGGRKLPGKCRRLVASRAHDTGEHQNKV